MRVRELPVWLFAMLVVVTVTLLAIMAVSVVAATQRQQEDALRVTCQLARDQQNQLAALDDIARSLGIPTHFTIPEVPAECDGS